MFSPNDKYIVTGTSTMSDSDTGKLAIFDRDSLEKLHELTVSDSVIIKISYKTVMEKGNSGNLEGLPERVLVIVANISRCY